MDMKTCSCPKHHQLIKCAYANKENTRKCDICSIVMPASMAFSCVECDYDLCQNCASMPLQPEQSPLASGYPNFPTKLAHLNYGKQTHHTALNYAHEAKQAKTCKNGHEMKQGRSNNNTVTCDDCHSNIIPSQSTYCDLCNFDICLKCLQAQ